MNPRNSKSIEYNGVRYSSIKELSKKYDINYDTLKSRINHKNRRCMSINESIKRGKCNNGIEKLNAKPQVVFGIQYDSISEACRAYGRDRSTVGK